MQLGLEEARSRAKDAIIRARSSFIGNQQDVPDFLQDNEYIKSGYRVNHSSCCLATKSLFTCHNESVNVWSHLLGSLCFFGLFIGLCCLILPFRFESGRQLIKEYESR